MTAASTAQTATREIHVCLVSAQLVPNLIPALMRRPEQVHLVVSRLMAETGRRLQRLLEDRGLDCVVHRDAPDHNVDVLQDYATEVAEQVDQYRGDSAVVLNATGGTKLMAMAFMEVFRDLLGAHIIYTDTSRAVLEYVAPRSRPQQPFTPVLDVESHLCAQGMTLRRAASDQPEWRERAEHRKALTKHLAKAVARGGRFLGALNACAGKALDRAGNTLTEPVQHLNASPREPLRSLLKEMQDLELLEWNGGREIRFDNVPDTLYLGGHWLEDYAWHVVRDEQPDDVRVGVEGTWEGSPENAVRNEFDLLAVHLNRMLVVECKTAEFGRDPRKDSDILYKLDSLGRSAGGLFGTNFLISARPLTERTRARAKANRIEVLEGKAITRLREAVRAWLSQAR
ncbi:MAG TPA: DUF1887 family CARF protein [Gammaproteobacteria bacterium]|nr:DUF1887 family CARF protein [Gammaproteobacteria bacterium]